MQEGGKRKLSEWNIFVKKVYREGKAQNSNYKFSQALSDASKRKSEMGSSKMASSSSVKKNGSSKSRKSSKKSKKMGFAGGKTRRRRRM